MTSIVVRSDLTTQFRAALKQTTQSLLDMSRIAADVRSEYGYAPYIDWLSDEFGLSRQTGDNLLNIYKNILMSTLKFSVDTLEQIAPSALYILAARSTPEGARQEVLDRAEQGETISHAAAREIVSSHKNEVAQCPYCGNYHAYSGPRDKERYGDYPCKGRGEWRDLDAAERADLSLPEWNDGEDDDVLDPPMEPAQATDLQRPRINAGMFTSDTYEWYTPRLIIDRVLQVFGEIDLDPCSNSTDPDVANVPAGDYFTAEIDGLAQRWHGRVYMNPPYGDEIPPWVDRLVQAYEGDEIDEAIALLPARTDTNWFRPLGDYVIAFIKGRLRFSGADSGAPFPSVVVYLGPDKQGFIEAFEDVSNFILRSVRAA